MLACSTYPFKIGHLDGKAMGSGWPCSSGSDPHVSQPLLPASHCLIICPVEMYREHVFSMLRKACEQAMEPDRAQTIPSMMLFILNGCPNRSRYHALVLG